MKISKNQLMEIIKEESKGLLDEVERSVVDDLEDLAILHGDGDLSDREYEILKRKVLEAPTSSQPQRSVVDDLEDLAILHGDGDLSDREYEILKRKVLNKEGKVTKSQLKQIIEEEFAKVKSGDIRKTYQTGIKQKTGSGVTDQERGIIQQLQNQLAQAAKVGNIASGKVLRLANLLSQELSKAGTEEPSQREPQDRGGLDRSPRPGAASPPPGPRPRDPQARKPSKRGQALTVTRESEKRSDPGIGAYYAKEKDKADKLYDKLEGLKAELKDLEKGDPWGPRSKEYKEKQKQVERTKDSLKLARYVGD